MKKSKWVHYYDPSKGSDQDKCVKDHPLCDRARRCARISTSEDKGHIYVALLNVHRQWKHYVGKADHLWENRWKDHEQSITSTLNCLLKNSPTQEASEFPPYSHIKMATAILEFILEGQSAPTIVVYKVQCSLASTAGLGCIKSYEQHFINAFSDISDTEELNSNVPDKPHSKGKCPFSVNNIPCKDFLDKCLGFVEGHWAQGSEFKWFPSPVATCITFNEHQILLNHQKHPLQQTVQKAASISKSDSSTGAQVHIALISIANTYLHSIHVTKYPSKTGSSDKLIQKDFLSKGAQFHRANFKVWLFNYMCHPDKQGAVELLSAIHHAAKPPATPIVSLYTVATVEGTRVDNDHDMRSVQQHFINALDRLMEGGSSTLVNPPEEGDRSVHSGDACTFSSNEKLSCSEHLTKALEKKSDWSLKFNEDRRTYDCAYEVLTHQ